MNRTTFIRHIEAHGCFLWREGAKHSIYRNPANGAFTAVPRHRTLKKFLAQKICDDLGIPRP